MSAQRLTLSALMRQVLWVALRTAEVADELTALRRRGGRCEHESPGQWGPGEPRCDDRDESATPDPEEWCASCLFWAEHRPRWRALVAERRSLRRGLLLWSRRLLAAGEAEALADTPFEDVP